MSDEQQIRELLTLAAELPDDVQPPVRRLIERGHRRRIRRFIVAALATAAVAVASVVVPPLVRIPAGGRFTPSHVTIPNLFTGPPPDRTGPTAIQISRFVWARLQTSPLGARSQPILPGPAANCSRLGALPATGCIVTVLHTAWTPAAGTG